MTGLEQFINNEDNERDGVWDDWGEFRVRIARAGGTNASFMKAALRQHKKLKGVADNVEKLKAKNVMMLVEHLVKDWVTKCEDGNFQEGIQPLPQFGELELNANKLVPFNKKNLYVVLQALPDLAARLAAFSEDDSNYRDADVEESAKN